MLLFLTTHLFVGEHFVIIHHLIPKAGERTVELLGGCSGGVLLTNLVTLIRRGYAITSQAIRWVTVGFGVKLSA